MRTASDFSPFNCARNSGCDLASCNARSVSMARTRSASAAFALVTFSRKLIRAAGTLMRAMTSVMSGSSGCRVQ